MKASCGIVIGAVLLSLPSLPAWAVQSPRQWVQQANALYQKKQYQKAISAYDQALVNDPEAVVPKFNKANSYFRLDDLSKAQDLYKQVAVKSKDMGLVAKAKYNLGNTLFHEGLKQSDSNPKKAISDVNDAIRQWQSTLDLRPKDTQAARNIEVGRLTIKDLLDRLKKQQQKKKQKQGQQRHKKQGQKQGQKSGQKQKQGQQKQKQKKQQPGQKQANKQKQAQSQHKQQQRKQAQQAKEPNEPQQDMTAQAILDKEQRDKKARAERTQVQQTPVLKDW